jgi:hypothetical protein
VAPLPSRTSGRPRILERAIDGAARNEPATDPDRTAPTTVEAEVRSRVAEQLGGARGSIEIVAPFALFTLAYVITDEVRASVAVGVGIALVAFAVRLVQRSSTRHVVNGLFAIGIGAAFALMSGRAETAFLPGIIQSGFWAAGLGVSIVVRWPAAGFLVGAVLGDTTGWRDDPAIVRLSNRLTLVLLVPMVLRVAVQYPLYLSGEVGWLGVSRVALGWPLSAVAFAVAAAILARGNTPLYRQGVDGARA